ncbi:hypothetical protein GQ466_28145 [Actinomadura rayongensis]|uniref:Histidine kinase domain-containing protein n=2 Tax=Actinomadura rayongensis TaxID=1429076 RepID=A0A6I4WG17_9ACTN|nr:hypothetical protein [Actinomadura rayongensis]
MMGWLERHLHDEVLQSLAVARIRIDRALAAPGPLPRDLGTDLRELLDREIAGLRAALTAAERPDPAEPGLARAVAADVARVARATGIRAELDDRTRPRAGWTPRDLAAYRIVHEALHNAAKHSGARTVRVALAERRGRLVCRVRDDGRGFDPAAVPRGLGLTAMDAQARAAGGALAVAPGRPGTLVTLVLPAAPERRSDATSDDPHRRRPSRRAVRDPLAARR